MERDVLVAEFLPADHGRSYSRYHQAVYNVTGEKKWQMNNRKRKLELNSTDLSLFPQYFEVITKKREQP